MVDYFSSFAVNIVYSIEYAAVFRDALAGIVFVPAPLHGVVFCVGSYRSYVSADKGTNEIVIFLQGVWNRNHSIDPFLSGFIFKD